MKYQIAFTGRRKGEIGVHCPLCGEDISKPNPYGKHGCGFSQQ